jgi:hypothetical protein
VPWSQAHVGQRFALLRQVCKHPIVTFLGRIDRSEERSNVSGYDDRRSFPVCRDPRATNLTKRGG